MKKIWIALLFVFMAAAGFWLGIKVAMPGSRIVETTRMESCLRIYRDYRKDPDQTKLAAALAGISLTPRDFQDIIDRFIHYRSRKSSMDQAMRLLQAFRMGYDIEATGVFSVSGVASEPFRLDAEILAVFESRPDLIKEAFEG